MADGSRVFVSQDLLKRAQQAFMEFLLQRGRMAYENLKAAIKEARHDLRHQLGQLSALVEEGDLEKIITFLSGGVYGRFQIRLQARLEHAHYLADRLPAGRYDQPDVFPACLRA